VATLRLFASLREIAGSARVELEANTVEEALASAGTRFGPDFAARLSTAAVWRNGESAHMGDALAPGDELAILPPVSGGAPASDFLSLTSLALAAVLVVANIAEGDAWWAAALVGVAGLWVVDVSSQTAPRGRRLPLPAVLLTILGAAMAVHSWGMVGLGATLALAVIAVMAYGVFSRSIDEESEQRDLATIAPGVVLAMLTGAGVGSLMLARTVFQEDVRAATLFLIITVGAVTVGSLLEHLPNAWIDPFLGTALTAVAAAVVAALIWDQDWVSFLLVGLGVALALVAGRGFGSIVRTGRVTLTRRAAGVLASLDGVVLAAALYFFLLRIAI
jgi:molybdopterin converting factor small subunit